MKTCSVCENEIPHKIRVDGKWKYLNSRKYCLDCSPFGSRNTRQLEKNLQTKTPKVCTSCYLEKDISSFPKKTDGRIHCYCMSCIGLHINDKPKDVKTAAINYLGGKCKHCGYNACNKVLDFHHTDPTQKDFNISKSRSAFNKKLTDELDKCILLCSNCHREEHQRLDKIRHEDLHGTEQDLQKRKEVYELKKLSIKKQKNFTIPSTHKFCNNCTNTIEKSLKKRRCQECINKDTDPNHIKTCISCYNEKPQHLFNKNTNRGKKSFLAYCKVCMNTRRRNYFKKVKEDAIKYLGSKCKHCNYDKSIAALEFHHTNPDEKDFSISRFRGTNIDKIKPELDKCILLCSNCHREEHHRIFNIKDQQRKNEIEERRVIFEQEYFDRTGKEYVKQASGNTKTNKLFYKWLEHKN